MHAIALMKLNFHVYAVLVLVKILKWVYWPKNYVVDYPLFVLIVVKTMVIHAVLKRERER